MVKIEKLETIDRKGNKYSFEISEEPMTVGKFEGIYYKIRVPNCNDWKHFVFQILFMEKTKFLYL